MSAPRDFTWDIGEAMRLERLPYDPSQVIHVRPALGDLNNYVPSPLPTGGWPSTEPNLEQGFLLNLGVAIVLGFIAFRLCKK